MTTRILPPEEWSRLSDTVVSSVLPYVMPGEMDVIVVEDSDRIVACWTVMRIVHLEGLWIDPAYRGKASVARQLFTLTWRTARRWAPRWLMTAATDDAVKDLLTKHLGAVAIPGENFVVNVQGRGASLCR